MPAPTLSALAGHRLRRAAASCALLLALGCAGGALAQTVEGIPIDGQQPVPAEKLATAARLDNPIKDLLKGTRRVAVAQFNVEFVTKGAASASSYRFGERAEDTRRASTNMVVTLTGLSPADFQALADAAYERTLADLRAQGLEVLTPDQIAAAAAYRKLTQNAQPTAETRTQNTWSVVHAPTGLLVWGEGATSTASVVPGLAALQGLGSVVSTISNLPDLSKELDAVVLGLRIVVGFVDLKSSDRSWFARTSGEAKVGGTVGPLVVAGSTAMSIARFNAPPPSAGTGGLVRSTLVAPLVIDGAAFTGVKDTSSIAGNIGLAVLNMAIGRGGTSSAVEKEVVADPERYRALVAPALATASRALVGSIEKQF